MKTLKLFILAIINITPILSQTTITWDISDNKDSILEENLIINFDNISDQDSIDFGGINKKIKCSSDDTKPQLFVMKLNDSLVQIRLCNDSISLKIEFGGVIEIFEKKGKRIQLAINKKRGESVGTKGKNTLAIDFGNHFVYYDAMDLLYGTDSVKKLILNKYNGGNGNKYLENIVSRSLLQNASKGNISFSPSSLLGLDVTNYVDGLAKFLVSRVKQELILLYFNDFSKAIRDTSLKDIQVLFKNTYGVLDLVGDKIYDLKPFLNSVRGGMEDDFKVLPESFHSLLKDENSQLYKAIDSIKNVRFIAITALNFSKAIKDNDHIGIALANLLPSEHLGSKTDTALIGTIQSLQLFSESLRDSFISKDTIYWVDRTKINNLIQNDSLLTCFMGLVTQLANVKNIKFSPNKSLYEVLNIDLGPTKITKFKSLFNALKFTFGKIQNIHKDNKIITEMEPKPGLITNYFDAAHSLISTSNEFIDLFNLKGIKPQIQRMLDISSDLNGIVKNVSVKKYSTAAINLGQLLKNLHIAGDQTGWQKTILFVSEKVHFIGQMAEAQSSDQVDSLLQIYAAPIGSWRDKRTTKLNVALDSYVGPAAFITNDNQRIALSSPIGLSLTFPVKKYQLSFLLSAIDIGPATAFRFKNDTSEVSKITLGEIVSPGLFASFNFGPSFPLTLNVGYQQYSLLKKTSNQSNDYNESRKGGLSVSFNMNIPILTLFNRRQEERYSPK